MADVAKAAKVYAQRQKLGKEAELYAHQIVIDAETLLGTFLQATPKNKGTAGRITGPGRSKKNGSAKQEPPFNQPETLESVGITKIESSNGQFLAKLKDEKPDLHDAIHARLPTASRYDDVMEAAAGKSFRLCGS